jgi:hypothetical protein
MRVGDLVRFKASDVEKHWQVGLLIRYDKYIKIGEIQIGDAVYYAPGRLIQTYRRGKK